MGNVFFALKMIVVVLLGLSTMTGMIGCSSGGPGDSQSSSSSSPDTPAPGLTPAHIDLLVSSPNLDSDGKTPVTMTALVKDGNNVALSGKDVSFAATSGVITVVNATTDASGRAMATLGPGSDKSNRTITVTAASGAKTVANTVNVIGTVFQITGENTLALGSKTTLTIYLKDSSGGGISGKTVTLASAQGNTFNNSAVTTDWTGRATVEVTAAVAGADTVTASVTSLNVTGTFSLNVSSTRFTFTTPTPNKEVNIGATQDIKVRYEKTGIGPAGVRVNFTTTRGTLNSAFALTDANGDATVTVSSATVAGPAVITASVTGDTSIQQPIEFVAIAPDLMTLQANPATIGPNLTVPATEASTITAVVFDLIRNRVKNKIIDFELTDHTLGSISPLSAQTDSLGQASTVFTPGPATSGLDGVSIKATVRDTPGVTMTVRLTVAKKALFISLGANNKITNPVNTPQAYQFDYVVVVSDAAGNPVANATVNLNVVPVSYHKGHWELRQLGPDYYWLLIPAATGCRNEDLKWCTYTPGSLIIPGAVNPTWCANGFFDPNEDNNGNGVLDPRNVAVVSTSVTTDANGVGIASVIYAKEYSPWVTMQLQARTTVAGTEGIAAAEFTLPFAIDDYPAGPNETPPPASPFGQSAVCTDTL